jgi:hypothetical protein
MEPLRRLHDARAIFEGCTNIALIAASARVQSSLFRASFGSGAALMSRFRTTAITVSTDCRRFPLQFSASTISALSFVQPDEPGILRREAVLRREHISCASPLRTTTVPIEVADDRIHKPCATGRTAMIREFAGRVKEELVPARL